MVGSLTGAVSSQSVTEEFEGTLVTVGHRDDSAMAQACLTARLTSRAGAKAGHKEVRELGLKRRETVWSLSSVGVADLRKPAPSTRGPEWTHLWCTCCHASGIAG